ncbi:hypothetical protein Tco_1112222 [Tanacetum coccineum]|uniref:Uncharacterized protein n=1 Tax=Tanacetum coccineum TaxID=301880 RepID=A0ABQ5IP01_9ASTR
MARGLFNGTSTLLYISITDIPYLKSSLTLRSGEDSMKLIELMAHCIKLSELVPIQQGEDQQSNKSLPILFTILPPHNPTFHHLQEDLEDPSKQGRRITEIDQNPSISLVQDEGTLWIQEDARIQGRTSADTEIILDQEELQMSLLVMFGCGDKVYIRRSAEKRKDKGKAIMKEDESVQKKTKKKLEHKTHGHEEAIRLQEQINEEESQRIVRDAEIAK